MILAPMQGLTEVLFRRAYEECFPGAIPLAVAPFISLTHNMHNAPASAVNSQLADVLPANNQGSIPVIPQILGKEPDEFVLLADRLSDMGYDEVNWNMGCPMRKVTGKHRGSGILPYPDEVRSLLDQVMPRLRTRLSVKMRIGLRDKSEIFKIIPILNDYPISSVTIHPRLGRQQYGGVPDMQTFAEALPLIKHPVIYNGDICSAADAARIRERYPQVADIMVGRGILYRPTLPLEIDNPKMATEDDSELKKQNSKFILHLLKAIKETFPTEQSRIRKAKEYWCLLWKSLPVSELQAREVLRQQEFTAVDNLIYSLTQ